MIYRQQDSRENGLHSGIQDSLPLPVILISSCIYLFISICYLYKILNSTAFHT